MTVDLAREQPFRLGELWVEPARRLVRSGDQERSLEPRVMQVLLTFVGAEDGTLSRAELRERCWEGRATSDDAIDRVIARIRRLSEELGAGSFTIETIPKVGYRLKAVGAEGEGGAKPARSPWTRRLVIGGALAAAGAGVALTFRRAGEDGGAQGEAARPLTIAVLPFRSAPAGIAAEPLARTLSDELRANLGRVREIRVIAETSSSAAAAAGGSARAIGERLGADLLVEGQVSAGSGDVRVQAALIDSGEQRQIWSEAFSGRQEDFIPLRFALSGALVQQLAGLIPQGVDAGEAPVRRPDPQAYGLVAEANRLLAEIRSISMRGQRREALGQGERAEALARRALAIDANYSSGWLVLATIARNGWTPALAARPLSTLQRVQSSIQYVRRALLADPSDPAALTQLGDYYRRFEFRWDEAENLFRRALALNPSQIEAHWSYGYMLGTTGRAREGLEHAATVFELDPGNPFRRLALPRLLYLLGQRGAAMRRYDIELAAQPANLFLLRELQFMFLSEGSAADLTALLGTVRRHWSGASAPPDVQALIDRIEAGIEALAGRPARLKALVDANVAAYDTPAMIADATPQGRARDDLPYIFSIEYAWGGAVEPALDMLERALIAKSLYWPPTLPFGIAPFPAAVRRHPRFAALWRRDPGLRQLVARRRRALLTGQMAGFAPDGRRLAPRLSEATVARVRALLARR